MQRNDENAPSYAADLATRWREALSSREVDELLALYIPAWFWRAR